MQCWVRDHDWVDKVKDDQKVEPMIKVEVEFWVNFGSIS
jgi:hypothetical protein